MTENVVDWDLKHSTSYKHNCVFVRVRSVFKRDYYALGFQRKYSQLKFVTGNVLSYIKLIYQRISLRINAFTHSNELLQL